MTNYLLQPYICVRDAAAAIAFYKQAFGATESYRLTDPQGKIGHAELRIGDALLMLADEAPEYGCEAPKDEALSPVTLHLTVPNVNELTASASAAGATVIRPPQDEFYGMRSATLKDPFGHRWMIATPREQLSDDEIVARFHKLFEVNQ